MVIIVEGIDRVGKTTLCKKLESVLGYKRFRDDFRYYGSYTDISVNTDKINTLMNLIEGKFVDNIILDRFHLTEYVYGVVDRDYINKSMLNIDERLGAMSNVIMLYVEPTDINISSQQHHKDLKEYYNLMNVFAKASYIPTLPLKYKDINSVVDALRCLKNNKFI